MRDRFRSEKIGLATSTDLEHFTEYENNPVFDLDNELFVVREKGQTYLSPDEVPELLDEELPQQLLVSAFRRYRR